MTNLNTKYSLLNTIYIVDAFTNRLFGGNPAAVCPLEEWLSDELMQKIAMENNLSETAYFVSKGDDYELRWFRPRAEVKLCGHATLATAYVIFLNDVLFPNYGIDVRSGHRDGTDDSYSDIGLNDWVKYYELERHHQSVFRPRVGQLTCSHLGTIVVLYLTGRGLDDLPKRRNKDWSQRLGKNTLSARQLSARVGLLTCTLAGERVFISGEAVLYLKGEIKI